MKQSRANTRPLKAGTRQELARLQKTMHRLITRPMPPTFTLNPRARADADTLGGHASRLFTDGPKLSALDRLEVYNQQYWYRTLECMEEDFPAVRAVVGAEKFQELCIDYLITHPPCDFQLRNLGDRFALYLKRRPKRLGRRHAVVWQLAQVEWAKVEAFDRAQLPPLDPGVLSGANIGDLKLCLQPHVTLITSDFALDDFEPSESTQGSAGDQGNAGASAPTEKPADVRPMPKRRKTRFVVYRQGHRVYFKPIFSAHMLLLEMIDQGRSMADVAYAVFRVQARKGRTTSQTIKDIQHWFEVSAREGWVTLAPEVA